MRVQSDRNELRWNNIIALCPSVTREHPHKLYKTTFTSFCTFVFWVLVVRYLKLFFRFSKFSQSSVFTCVWWMQLMTSQMMCTKPIARCERPTAPVRGAVWIPYGRWRSVVLKWVSREALSKYNARKVCLFGCLSVISLWRLLCCTVTDPDRGVWILGL